MTDQPPPYSVRAESSSRFVICRNGSPLYPLDCHARALIERDKLNAAYMQGWRDRDEQENNGRESG